ncbi:MAG: hypothetical protein IJO74_03130 [Clostridia bacterium]|nr:hypothetical protein [Clostridia bacterium]
MKKQTKFVLLILWFILCLTMYYTAIHFQFEPIVIIYGSMSIIFGAAFFLVNGGVRPIIKTTAVSREDTSPPKEKKRNRYKPANTPLNNTPEDNDRINIFSLTPQKQKFFAELFIILFLPPTAIIIADYVLIAFLPDYI